MGWKLPGLGTRAIALGARFLLLATPAAAQDPASCRPGADSAVVLGWRAYRGDSLDAAAIHFARAKRLCPTDSDASNGLGFVAFRRGDLRAADSLFRAVVIHDSANADAWEGLTRTAYRQGNVGLLREAARRALTLNPGNTDLRALIERGYPDWNRVPARSALRPSALRVGARTRGDRFEVPVGGRWKPMYVQGVNLGVALPGRFPAEFPSDSAIYAGWLAQIAGMNANAVRVYTILPPTFYRALRGWNVAHPERTLYLVHGVWTELPPPAGDPPIYDFDRPDWKEEFRAEMRRVVDLIHGAVEIAPRPGHASGVYDADVSPWVLAYVIGREWEPHAVETYVGRHSQTRPYRGRFLAMDRGSAIDAWMAEQCDFLLAHEVDRYNAIRPIAYTNWPTLDPLHHPTESTSQEEANFRRDDPRRLTAVAHEEDVIALDATLIRPTAANPAGWFASFHAYPYYPDFMNLDPGYARARFREGPSNYFGYLTDLKRYHAGLPLLIAEFGVPSSRGVAHFQPQGWHHGGHDEQAMATIDARLAREIHASGAAGGILFAWMDEWFKRNWLVANYEIPADHTPRWHNAMDAEQHYGVLGTYAGDGQGPVLGGEAKRWIGGDSAPANAIQVEMSHDAAYLYLGLRTGGPSGREFPWDSLDVLVAFDTYAPELGQKRIPAWPVDHQVGFEFVAIFRNPHDAELRVTPDYNPYATAASIVNGENFGRTYRHPAVSVARADGELDSLFVITNRARYGRDGTFFPAQGYNRGRLQFGTARESTLADWYYDREAGLLELRLPWALLNVTDPSSRRVLAGTADMPFGTLQTEGFRVGVVVRTDQEARVVRTYPLLDAEGRWMAGAFRPWQWPAWVDPVWHSRLKPVYDSLKTVWERTR